MYFQTILSFDPARMADQDPPNWPVQASVAGNPNPTVHRPIPLASRFMINGNPFMHPNIPLAPTFEANQLATWHQNVQLQHQLQQLEILNHQMRQQQMHQQQMHQQQMHQQQMHQQQMHQQQMPQPQMFQPQNLEVMRRAIMPPAPNLSAFSTQGAPVATSQAAVLQYDPIQQILQHNPSLLPFFLQLQLHNQQVHGNFNNQILPVTVNNQILPVSAEQSPAMSASEVSNSSLSPLEGANAIAASGSIDDSEAVAASEVVAAPEAVAALEAIDALEGNVHPVIQPTEVPLVEPQDLLTEQPSEQLVEIAVANDVPRRASEGRGNSKKNKKVKTEEAEMQIQLNAVYEEEEKEIKTEMSSFLREDSQKVQKEGRKLKGHKTTKTGGVDRSRCSTSVPDTAAETRRNEESPGDTLQPTTNSEEIAIKHESAASSDGSSISTVDSAPTAPSESGSAPTPLITTPEEQGVATDDQKEETTVNAQQISPDVDPVPEQRIQMEMSKSDGDKEEEEEEEDLKLTSSQPISNIEEPEMEEDDQGPSTSQTTSTKVQKVYQKKKCAVHLTKSTTPVKRGRPRKAKKEESTERLRSPSPRPKRKCRAEAAAVVAEEEDEVISDEDSSDTTYEECGRRCALEKYCFTREPPAEEVVTLEWIGCSYCPRWYHVFCLKMKNEKYHNEETDDVLDCCNAVIDGSEIARAKIGRTYRKFHGIKKGRRPVVGHVKKRKGEYQVYDYVN
ncbi:hypothetical protein B9Z55_026489 [Caenorhabditis nigoni]|uniref:PHD-type domain-containing protein n=1 Tax=Caenorhabditis nigoni TaxID=1611254 RepID=A0A2G5T3K3_9PELO|nr:hypothetical protein B9Z55_026489 [Caenorhabditis nigoni]